MGLFLESLRGHILAFLDDEKNVAGSIVALASLFLLSSFGYYPLWVVLGGFLLTFVVGREWPALGLLLAEVLAFPIFASVHPSLAWSYLFLVAISVFELFEHWASIALVISFSLAPLTPFGFLSALFLPVLFLSSLVLGSRETLFLVFLSYLLSVSVSSLFGVKNHLFPVGENLRTLPPANYPVFSLDALGNYPATLGLALHNVLESLFSGGGLYLAAIALASFLAARVPALLRLSSFPQTAAALSMVLPALVSPSLLPSWFLTLLLGFSLDLLHVRIFREHQILAQERMKKFGKFGVVDLLLTAPEMEDIGNYEEIKKEITSSFILPTKPEVAYYYGIKPPKGILLFGPPGCGKTMLVSAVAKRLGYHFYYVKSSDLLSRWFGQSEKNISLLFSLARKNQPCVLFFDEVEMLGGRRELNPGPAARALATLLQEMDGLKMKSKVVVVGATNRPDLLDPALLRPGRFDKLIYVPLPDERARMEILKVLLRRIPHEEVDLQLLAKKTQRFSGADLKNLVEEAKRLAAEEALRFQTPIPLKTEHFLKVLEGLKPSVSLEELEKYERFRQKYERSFSRERPKEKRLRWQDVADLKEAKEAFEEALKIPLIFEEKARELGLTPPKGILLFGPPGCGKTMLVSAAAGELGAELVVLLPSDFSRGNPSAILREAFHRARENPPSILFVDELEMVFGQRGALLNQFLQEMEKLGKGVVVVGATNRPDLLDPALLRPGRFDKLIYVPPPDKEGRKEMFRIHLGKLAKGMDLGKLAEASEGFTGADIFSVCQKVKMRFLREWMKGREVVPTTSEVLEVIKETKPSLPREWLSIYASFLEKYGPR